MAKSNNFLASSSLSALKSSRALVCFSEKFNVVSLLQSYSPEMNFPIYRRYANGKSYFQILNPSELLEVQLIGKYFVKHRLVAKILPERNLISDLIALEGGQIEALTEAEFLEFMKYCTEELQEKSFD
jgi:hypothetical protein